MQLKVITDANNEQIAELEAMVEQVKESVQQSLNSFTSGECDAAELQERLLAAGVQVTCTPEQLEDIRTDPEATYASNVCAVDDCEQDSRAALSR